MESTELSLQNVSKSFGGLLAVNKLDLKVPQGKILSLIGPNGAGKTTVFNMITGVYPPSQGDITFHGIKLNNLKSNRIIAHGIARTFQNIRLFKSMTVLENVQVGMHCRTKSGGFRALLKTRFEIEEEKENHYLGEVFPSKKIEYLEPKILAFDIETYGKAGAPTKDPIILISFYGKNIKKVITWKKLKKKPSYLTVVKDENLDTFVLGHTHPKIPENEAESLLTKKVSPELKEKFGIQEAGLNISLQDLYQLESIHKQVGDKVNVLVGVLTYEGDMVLVKKNENRFERVNLEKQVSKSNNTSNL